MDFRIISVDGVKKHHLDPLNPHQRFPVPPQTTHVHVRAGKICFGISQSDYKETRTNRGKFFKNPLGDNAKSVSFPQSYFNPSGHFYGKPEWHLY